MSWAHIEAVLDPSNKAAIFENARLRHITQVYQSLVDIGVPKAPVTSDDVVVPTKRKRSDLSSDNKSAKKLVIKTFTVQELTARPRRHERGKYPTFPRAFDPRG